MYRNFYIYPTCALLFFVWLAVYFIARKHLFRSEELFVHTPSFDEENVEKKHQIVWFRLGLATFLPMIYMLIENMFDKFATLEVYEIYHTISKLPLLITAPCVVILMSGIRYGGYTFFNEPYVVTRYMVYPSPFKLSVIVSFFATAIISTITMAGYVLFTGKADFSYIFDGDIASICLVAADFFVVILANYAIIRYFYNTSRELVLGDVPESEYDAVAKRYYGIWRNRLILANLAAGAQLILGGFVTLTNAGDSLMGIRILGLVILAVVFAYILIQSRDFEDPVVVKGMVYPSERKRVTLKWVVLSAIALYILGAVILL